MTSTGRLDPTKKHLAYGIDVVSAIAAACAVAPGIKIVDQVVTQRTADKSLSVFRAAYQNALTLFKTPRYFLTQPTFAFVCLVYSGTYVTANSMLTYCEYEKRDSKYPKLGSTTAVNMTLGILKDRYFARVFSGRAPESFPLISWGLFVCRDLMTIAAGFTIPPYVAKALQDKNIISNSKIANAVSQVTVPMIAQIVLTPIHLLSLDFYMNKQSDLKGRYTRVAENIPDSTVVRMGRVLFAYGIAGIFNTNVRNSLRESFAYEHSTV